MAPATRSAMPAPRAARPFAPPAAPLSDLKGIGPAKVKILAALGLRTIEDALYAMPLRHEDRSKVTPIWGLRAGDATTVIGCLVARMGGRWSRRERGADGV